VDWDEDGRKDLILGERDGHIRIYLNTNTDADPVFSGYTYVQMGGSDFDVGYTSSPYICDWDNDGDKDLLCGEDGGTVWLLVNTGTNASPVFPTYSVIQNDEADLDVGTRACPVVVDWDDDGKKDLLVGETYGNIRFFPNTGTDPAPLFAGSTLLDAGGSTIDVGYYARFEVADWDEDGTLDLLSGYYDTSSSPIAGVFYFRGQAGGALADLAVTSFTSPTQAAPDETVGHLLDLVIVNQGSTAAGAFTIGIYISDDQEITTSDQLLVGGRENVSSLGAGVEFSVPLYAGMRIPSGIATGSYYIGALVDEFDDVEESIETNNDRSNEIWIGAEPPVLDIKIDGEDGPLTIPATQVVKMTIDLDPNDWEGVSMDWWVVAEKHTGDVYSWVYSIPWHWTSGVHRAHAGPLFAVKQYVLHEGTIPLGKFNIFFAVDELNNIYEGTFADDIWVKTF